MLSTPKTAELMLGSFKETYEQQDSMLDLVDFHEPDAADMQNSSNVIWSSIQQHAPIKEGWDLTGEETGIIEEGYPAVLGTPKNDLVQVRADDKRDSRYWERRAEQSGKRQATELNKQIAQAIATQGSLFYRSNDTSGYDFVSEAEAIMDERQAPESTRYFMLNNRDNKLFGEDLAGRQNISGRSEAAWTNGLVARDVAGFDVMKGSFLPSITGAADPAVTVTGNQAFVPSGGSINATTKVVTNVDYREASLVVNDSSLMAVGDKFTLQNTGTDVYSIGLADKTSSGEAMTFTVIELTDATHIKIYPKPIAADQTGITDLQAAYANIDTAILNAATITRLNTDATNRANIFWDKNSVEVLGGTIPAELFAQYEGMNVIRDTMKNGLELYMLFSGNMIDMTFSYRIFTWYGITVCNPSNCGAAVTY